jgi:hypothetical protein
MKFNLGVLFGALLVAVLLIMSSCESYIKYDHPDCPVCDESYASDEHLDSHCATNFEGEREALHIEAQERMETLLGSHDFFLEGEDKITSSLIATKCLTCGIHFTHPRYEEHIKTCSGVIFNPPINNYED